MAATQTVSSRWPTRTESGAAPSDRSAFVPVSKLELRALPEFGTGSAQRYRASLPDGRTALLVAVADRGWELNIYASSEVQQRGLFGSPEDIEALLQAEYNIPRLFDETDGARPRPLTAFIDIP